MQLKIDETEQIREIRLIRLIPNTITKIKKLFYSCMCLNRASFSTDK